MIFESADRQDEMYLAFHAGIAAYVLPLSDVGQIVAEIPENMPVVPLAGEGQAGVCAVIIQDEEGLAALTVGKVTGIVQIPSSCQYEIPDEAKSPGNTWIAGAAYLETTGELYYLLDCRKLRKTITGVQK